MDNITKIHLCWKLYNNQISIEKIPENHQKPSDNIDGESREKRMAKIWDLYNPQERIKMMLSGGINNIFIGHGQEYDPFLSWTQCGCSQKTAITNHCLRIFDW